MPRLLSTRRSEWLPVLLVFGALFGVFSLVGGALGWRDALLVLAGCAGALLGWGVMRRVRARRNTSHPAPPRAPKRAPRPPFDLASDATTKNQRYLM